MQPPIKLAIIVFHRVPKDKLFKHIYKMGLDNCHLSKYNENLFVLLFIVISYKMVRILGLEPRTPCL